VADHVDSPLRVLSICSGIGGLDLGVRRALHSRVVAYVERDPFAASVLMDRMEDEALDPAPLWCGDLRELDARPLAGHIDLICGGYPCQPFSHAGSRRGEEDPRHLWPSIVGLLRTVRPRYAFFENVAGHLRLGFDAVLSDLAALGFDVRWGLVRASDVGAPHRRERLFIFAWTRSARKPDGWLLPPMADAERTHFSGRGRPHDLAGSSGRTKEEGLQQQRRRDAADDCESALGNAHGKGLEGRDRPEREGAYERPPWPPGPEGDWSDVPKELWPATEPPLRGVVDGLPDLVDLAQLYRTDRLRALGNAVVPAQAEHAIRLLLERVRIS